MATGAQTTTLAIIHVEGSNPPAFVLTRSDHKSLAPVNILTPYEFPVEGSPQFRLMRQLRWYLERFLDYPYHPDTIAAEHVLDAFKEWGSQAFNAIFDRREAGEWLKQANIRERLGSSGNLVSQSGRARRKTGQTIRSRHLPSPVGRGRRKTGRI